LQKVLLLPLLQSINLLGFSMKLLLLLLLLAERKKKVVAVVVVESYTKRRRRRRRRRKKTDLTFQFESSYFLHLETKKRRKKKMMMIFVHNIAKLQLTASLAPFAREL
jgi:hypothetical protein